MKECTLEQAISLCREYGGVFYSKISSCPRKYRLVKEGSKHRIYDTDGTSEEDKFPFSAEQFDVTWIYEPQKSAFKEWVDNADLHVPGCEKVNPTNVMKILMKSSWNAMNDRIVNDPQIMLTPSEVEKIKALKEP